MMFAFSAAARTEISSLATKFVDQELSHAGMGQILISLFFLSGLASMLIIAPIYMALRSISRRSLSRNNRDFLALVHYSLYGVLALTSYGFYSGRENESLFDNVNHGLTLFMLIVIVVRWFILILSMNRTPTRENSLLTDRQYHYSYFIMAFVVCLMVMYLLTPSYTNVAVLIFLTTTYTLLALKPYDLLFSKWVLTLPMHK
jgi:hypothetical protein